MSRGDFESSSRPAEQVDLLRRRIVNVVGHELRTPVTTLRGIADQLAHTDDPATRADLEVALQRNLQRLERLLDDVLVAAEVTTALPVGDPEHVDLVREVARQWDSLDDGSRAGRTLEHDGEPSLEVGLRPGTASRLVGHLVDNALKYGAGPLRVRAWREGSHAYMEMRSGGPTPVADDLDLAFELFYRGEAAVTSAPGLGVGLFVARALAQQHGGEVTLDIDADGEVVARLDLPAR